ncbi:putative quinol monooxygenase [Dyadobacter subterraneus]|uniref:Antibiotic biosynthesis monooxygenase n=1 Tax=Dyadobacter subterraneus TaxID=2773304 RepID=A0ABR9W762_9BACT|nr:antibiotic biosynthesis monooxygenase family protein [Dyadobacter subterraneus]MBE9461310.1 antibiotic biosynthesis monooxygenase [Dyadobacter subterraneus]
MEQIDNHTGEIQVIGRVQVKPERTQDFVSQFQKAYVPTKQDVGNLQFQLFKIKDKPNEYFVLERWKSKEALDAHMGMQHTQLLFSALIEDLTHPVTDNLYFLEEVIFQD